MRTCYGLALLGLLIVDLGNRVTAQDEKEVLPRYQIQANLEFYPQTSPKETLTSVLRCIERKRIDYLLAHLSDPDFVDERVRNSDGGFDQLVRDVTRKLEEDKTIATTLQKFIKDGEWDEADKQASARHKELKNRAVFFKKVGNRWFFENRNTPPAEPKTPAPAPDKN